jgi:hypothetical protein
MIETCNEIKELKKFFAVFMLPAPVQEFINGELIVDLIAIIHF